MPLSTLKKSQIIKEYSSRDGDTGRSEVQIALLTERIVGLTEHMSVNKKDYHTRRGLLKLVSFRKKLLKYLKNSNEERYLAVIGKLGLRK
jgi:small subunit ribosomal protein S15